MTLVAFWTVAVIAKDRRWILMKRKKYAVTFVAVGLVLAFVSEYTAIDFRNPWKYSGRMPVIPGVHIGLAPVLQWLFLPLIVVYLTKRSLDSPQ